MAIEIKVPALPESVADATVVKWHKQPGDAVKRDEVLVDLETDKVVLEIPAIEAGVLEAIVKPEGSVVTSHEVIGQLTAGGQASAAAPAATKAVASPAAVPSEAPKAADTKANASGVATPSARRAAGELNVDLSKVSGTGVGGRVTKADVAHTPASSPSTAISSDGRPEQRIPMTRLRARIAERLLQAKQNTAMLTSFNEVNMQAVINARTTYKEAFEKKYNVRLGFLSFFTHAVVETLKHFPVINASIDGNDIVYHGYYDIGIAVSTDRGLVVPVIRDADQLSYAEIEKKIIEYSTKARNGQITLEDITGGTFTITNGGVFGSLLSTPIVNPPQSAILGLHKIQERPVVENGQIVIRPMMYIALSYDHRIIDGKDSVQFLVTLKQYLEDPSRALLDI